MCIGQKVRATRAWYYVCNNGFISTASSTKLLVLLLLANSRGNKKLGAILRFCEKKLSKFTGILF